MGRQLVYVDVKNDELDEVLNELYEVERKLTNVSSKLQRLCVLTLKTEEAASGD